jgi:hypothetical protein
MLAMVCHSMLAIWVYISVAAVTAAYGFAGPCRSEHARDGLSFNVGYLGVHIHCCGNGRLGFRPYGDSLFYKRLKK